jgi:1-acyl-sn-glycerol-3-phosphate acyltransferase
MAIAQRNEERIANSEKRGGSLFSRLRSNCFFVPLIYLYTFIMGSFSLLSSFLDGDGRIQHWFAVHWARMILATSGVRVQVEGTEHVNPAEAAVYAANHLSALDIPVLYSCLPTQFRIMAKRELFSIPFMGWHLTRSGQIPIDQGNARTSLRSLNRASDSLRKGMPLAIFPEGGRSPSGQMRDFMGGAFYMAIKAQAPVIPIVIVGTYELLPMNSFHLRPGKAQMIICEPIPTKGMAPRQMDELSARVRKIMSEVYDAHSELSGCHPVEQRSSDPSGAILSEVEGPLSSEDPMVQRTKTP